MAKWKIPEKLQLWAIIVTVSLAIVAGGWGVWKHFNPPKAIPSGGQQAIVGDVGGDVTITQIQVMDPAQIKKLQELVDRSAIPTRDVHKPLAKDRQEKLIAGLKTLREEYSTISPSVSILFQMGSSVRGNVGADLNKYLQQAGWSVDLSNAMIFFSGQTPSLSVNCHPEDKQFLEKFIHIVVPLFININISKQINASVDENYSRGHLKIVVAGDPLFDDSGVVTFK